MRRLALSLMPLVFLACKKEPPTPEQAAVKLEVSTNLKAGCIQVLAKDRAETSRSSVVSLPVMNRVASDRNLVIAVFRGEDWGDTLEIHATAHERNEGDGEGGSGRSCAGREVASSELVVATLDKPGVDTRSVSLNVTATDADGDGYFLAANGGRDCDDANDKRSPDNPEVCDEVDNNCDPAKAVDEGFDKWWYRDMDTDGALNEASLTVQCDSPGTGYVHRSTQPFDCDDGDADRTPGKPEQCDGKDNDCEGGIDEEFPTKGNACTNDICTGTLICNAEKTAVVCGAPAPVSYHPDVDEDGQGAVGSAGTKFCAPNVGPAGTAPNATDCDDVDGSTRLGLAEACDAVDNNCNEQVDEGRACGGTLKRVVDGNLGGLGHDWRTVAVGPGGQPVWIAGLNGKLVRRGAVGGFQSFSFGVGPPSDIPPDANNCGDTDWYAAWVRPSDGSVFLAGEGGRVAQHTGTICTNQATATNNRIMTGMVGFVVDGVTTLYLVNDDGRLFTWVPGPGNAPIERDNASPIYNGIHALDPNLLLVAAETGGGNQFVTSYINGNLGGNSPHTMSNTLTGKVNAVWMGTPNLAYAVGDEGAIWRWDGSTRWTLLPTPQSGTSILTSVVTLPNGEAYTVDGSAAGQLHRRTPHGWARSPKLPTPIKPLYGIAMSSERDFWVVGDDGYVFHYPEP